MAKSHERQERRLSRGSVSPTLRKRHNISRRESSSSFSEENYSDQPSSTPLGHSPESADGGSFPPPLSLGRSKSAAFVPPFSEASKKPSHKYHQSRIFDDAETTAGYNAIPMLPLTELPRGGISVETKAVGRIQFGIPPETIKDSMRLGLEVPRIYIVPTERFCTELGPALGINLAEFEFPAYFNFFIRRKKCILVVDSEEAEENIRNVFEETLLGPRQFRDPENPIANDDEDFDPDFPKAARPDFYQEFRHFRVAEKNDKFEELKTDMLIEFCHFEGRDMEDEDSIERERLIGSPPPPVDSDLDLLHDSFSPESSFTRMESLHASFADFETKRGPTLQRYATAAANSAGRSSLLLGNDDIQEDTPQKKQWMFSQVKWLSELATIWPMDATEEQIRERTVPRVEIFKLPGSGTEYVIHDVDEHNVIVGKIRFQGAVQMPDKMAVEGFLASSDAEQDACLKEESLSSLLEDSSSGLHVSPTVLFDPPSFGVTVLGNSHGFDKNGSTSGYVVWVNGRGIMIDPPPYSSATLEREGIRPQMIFAVVITHCHADHDAGAFQKVLTGSRVAVITTPTIYNSFIRKYSALSGLSSTFLQHSHRFRPAIIGRPLKFHGATFHFIYTLHTIPCISFKIQYDGRSMVFTGDHLNLPPLLDELEESGVLSKGRADSLRQMPLQPCDVLLHEAGAPPIHTPLSVLQNLPETIKARLYVVHTTALPPDCGLRVAPTGTSGTIRLDQKPSSGLQKDGQCAPSAPDSETPGRSDTHSDAWFILNLLSNIPFLSSLSYIFTMEVLEIASIEFFREGETIVSASKRMQTLVVVWEGTCIDRKGYEQPLESSIPLTLWHAGDWMGPVALQPNPNLAAEAAPSGEQGDIVAFSPQGVKVITMPMKDLENILNRGSALYRKYLTSQQEHGLYGTREPRQRNTEDVNPGGATETTASEAPQNVLDTLKSNSVLAIFYARQLRSMETIAEGPCTFAPGEFLWRVGDDPLNAFLIISGTASFAQPVGRSRSSFFRGRSTLRHRQSSFGNLLELGPGHFVEADKLLHNLPPESEFARLEAFMSHRAESGDERKAKHKEQGNLEQNANKLFSRLYSSRKCITDLVLSRGCFLGDISRMVSGELVHETGDAASKHLHTSTIVAGPNGCVAWVFPRATLLPFLDDNPGVLLSLLGTQVVI